MADKAYRINFEMSDGTTEAVSFIAPQGEKGDTGAQGIQGDKGDKGDTGAAGKDGYTPVKGTDYFTEEDKAGMVSDVVSKTGIDVVPGYVRTEADSVIDRVIAAQGSRTFTFAAITDMHYGSWGYYEGVTDYRDGVKHACQALKYIDERVKLDAVAVLGDYTDGLAQTQQETAVADFKGVNSVLDKLRFAPNLRISGNHDFVAEKSPLVYRYIGAYNDGAVTWGDALGGYFYKDFPIQKIRVICLNTSETGNGGVYCSAAQYQWFVNSLDLSAKEDAGEWGVLILSHVPLDMWANNGEYRFAYILNAYQNGTSWTDGTISCDFSNGSNKAKLIGNIHGHVHNLKVDKLYLGNIADTTTQIDVWRVATPNACFGLENKYAGYQEDTTYTKTANSATDTAFCVYCVDLDSHTVTAVCYGAGYDRSLVYYEPEETPEEPVYINQLPISTDADGNVYNGVGYKADTRWSGSQNAEQEYSGVCLSGYISYDGNEGTVYLKNVATTSRLLVWYFEEAESFIVKRELSQNTIPDVVYGEDGNVTSFKLEAGYKYIRIEADTIDETSVITIDEPVG